MKSRLAVDRHVPHGNRSPRRKALPAALLAVVLAMPGELSAACLRGINLAGAEFGTRSGTHGQDYIFPADETIGYFAAKGFNAVRLPFRWERLQPRLSGAFDPAELNRLVDAVDRLRGAGLAVVLDPHNYAYYDDGRIGSPEVPVEAFADFWRRLAAEFKDDSGIYFGLMNEPHDVAAADWLTAVNAAISAIRGAGAGNLVYVPGTAWTGAHSWEADRPGGANGAVMLGVVDPTRNYAYEVHQYLDEDFSGTHASCEGADAAVAALQRFTAWLRQHNERGFLGEFGAPATPVCLAGLTRMVAVIRAAPDVWTGWTYWAAGEWWPETEPLNIQPTASGDRPQLKALQLESAGAESRGRSCPALEGG
ncbi:cellulase (glycosyl hydrolase family 5) [Mycoplana dimorpha]|uniref:Cellulase (Glycosyl hydrolase family 5) n=2 Tax=Mycoplana dimorpha TaxID=28320 RepID=A0A2T5BE30_MYCDI|nr:glycoside hydrolase family 5 protein [Mycoplana dimorpha]PTM97240.1 cellulase (glycosyl hydrolase family 5) [Mycoplana dimorpha]